MAVAAFDTHKFVRRLKEAGVPEAQAEAMSDAFKEAQGEAEFATKQDIAELKQEMVLLRRDLKELETRLTHDLNGLETKLTRDLKEMEMRLTIRLGLMLTVAVGAVATLVKLL